MPIQTIDAPTLKSWLDTGEAVLLDVREPAEYEAAHIAGAVLMPLARVSKNTIPIASGKKLVVHCKAGRRGGSACEQLLAEDPSLKIYNLEGGLDGWAQAGYAVQSSGKFFLPLDRQVQLTIGLGVLAGVVLGYILDPRFLLLPAIFGAGLVNAGLTGWCGLAILMAKMPWNKGKSMCKTGACHG